MPSPDLSALIRWPNVPACYGWLSLDRRGRWRLQGEPVTHLGFIEFINRQYGCDEAGNWFLQNGPQRVFARLDYTPWVIHRGSDGSLQTHTGLELDAIDALWMDEEGSLLLAFADGVGVLDDRDLAAMLNEIRDVTQAPVNDQALLAFMQAAPGTEDRNFYWRGARLARLNRAEVAEIFRFQPDPAAISG